MRITRLLISLGAVGLVAACEEQITRPVEMGDVSVLGDVSVMTAADSAVVLAELATRAERGPGGPALVGGTVSDSMVLSATVDSFRIELKSRECASPTNTVTVVSPDTVLLSEHMCQEGTSGAPGYTCWPPDPLGTPMCLPETDPADTRLDLAFRKWTLQLWPRDLAGL